MQESSCLRPCRAFALLALVGLFTSTPSSGQFRVAGGSQLIVKEEPANVFIRLEPGSSADGFLLDVPLSWQVLDARLVRKSGEVELVDLVAGMQGRLEGRTRTPYSSADHLVLTVQAGASSGEFPVLILTPTRRDGGSGRSQSGSPLHAAMSVKEKPRPSGNRGVSFVSAPAPAIVDADRLPELTFHSSYTLEFWMRSTGLDQVLVSTWSGDEIDPYPIELVIDPFGHVTAFQGIGEAHVSVRSKEPVSDGTWHHVALVYEARERWSRLMIDGARADSLHLHMALPSVSAPNLKVGGRSADSGSGYRGELDEFRIWSSARSASEIHRTMKDAHPVMGDEDYGISFDEEIQDPAFVGLPRVDSGLPFLRPLEEVGIELEPEGVRIVWKGQDPAVSAFVVERSADGRQFEELTRLAAPSGAFAHSPMEYVDRGLPEGVWYYRIRQLRPDGRHDLSRTMKIGMGTDDNERSAVLTGNFPNPFNPSTVITYDVREMQPVHLSVWDLSGQQIAVLEDGMMAAGTHEVTFNAVDLPSGTYFVRLRSNGSTQIRQIVLMK